MENIFKSKIFRASLLLLVLGIVFLCFENIFYQYIDENGVLHESLFMPLGVFSLLLGGIGLFFIAIKTFWLFIKRQ
jgi:hypothetical protein